MKKGHEVQYFGMEHKGRCVGNRVDAYTTDMDFHHGSRLSKLAYPVKTIYSSEARRKIRAVLDDFQPDICHLNNFNYQLTPSILLEIQAWRKQTRHPCGILYTAHDYQLICPNHLLHNPASHANCEKCLGGHFQNCMKEKCIHGSLAKSAVGMAEAVFWNRHGVYGHIDTIICCSGFMKRKLDSNPAFRDKTIVLHNFIDAAPPQSSERKDYVLYFGRYSQEKGIPTLLEACKKLPHIPFVFAGTGPLENAVSEVSNVRNAGFCTGDKLYRLIREARFSVYPSEWYENCPFSIMESQGCQTPVLGADIGGIPELITHGVDGQLFESRNSADLTEKIREMWDNPGELELYRANCAKTQRDSPESYTQKLLTIYAESLRRN